MSVELKEPLSVQNWVRAHPLYQDASSKRDALSRRVAELESLLLASDAMHRLAMSAIEARLSSTEGTAEELDVELRTSRERTTRLQQEVRDLRNRLGVEVGATDLCCA